ncbi:PAS domain S-box protein [Natronococcus sp. A-GB1]|uniref:PAS domain S-box protein n=1 Tax=Natronococcus sp. A-GB1 TaxID=3037648 RepID=UPI00241C2CF0|nr:PAS domain S-box protein [Natronococcus sp. A-GB1]MDG5759010.1 PAS domain S-box protein [Natronococcus sp. A-GB1]
MSDRAESTEELRWSTGSPAVERQRFRAIADALDGGVLQLDADGRIVTVTDDLLEITGYAREQLVDAYVSALFDADVLEREDEDESEDDPGHRRDLETVIETADGRTVDCTVRLERLIEEGEERGTVCIVRHSGAPPRAGRGSDDPDPRTRRLERSVEQLSSELDAVFDHISDAFCALDDGWRVTYVNDRAAELLGRPAEDLHGANVWEALPSLVSTHLEERLRTVMATKKPLSFERHVEPLDSWVQMDVYPTEVGISVYFRDVTEQVEREHRLAVSERRYRTLAEQFPNGIVALFDLDGEYTLAAGRGFDRLDADPADLEGKHFREVWDESVAATVGPAYQRALEGEEQRIELEQDGRAWLVHVVPVTDDGGNVVAGLTMAQDVTEQKERERFLQDAKAQLEAATEAGAVGTWEWRVQEDQFIAGAAFAKTFGVDPDEAREGVSLERFVSSIHPTDRDRVERSIEDALERCGEYEEEYRVRNADGDLRWIVVRGHVECDEDGTPRTFPGAVADITERKRAERKLQTHKRQLETLFEVLPVAVIVADADGRLIEANETARELWGGDVFDAEAIGDYDRYDGWWVDTDDPIEPEEWTMTRVLEGEEVTEPDVHEIETVEGDRRIVMTHGMPVRDDHGEVRRGVITQTDVTERREYQRRLEETIEKLETSNQRLERFAYAASHDLQEPLRMVSSYLRLLEDRYGDRLDGDAEEFLAFAVDGADRMREMIDGLLAYSRIDTAGEPLESVELEDVFDDVLGRLGGRIEESNAEIGAEALPRVEGDPKQLRQLLRNLLSNALTYSRESEPRITVSTERQGSMWRISVRDEGIGIHPDETERIFEVFHRLHTHDEYAGSGIGLALCRRIVERHSGEIWVDSEPGEGSTFSFTLPAADEAYGSR